MWQGVWERLLLVAFSGLLEGMGVPWPSPVVVAGAGMTNPLGMPGMLLIATTYGTAYSLGALLQYWAGRALGERALAWLPERYRVKVDRVLTRHGQLAVMLTRPFAIGNYVSAPAGVMRMPLRRFLPATFLGIVPWALGISLAGDQVGSALSGVMDLVNPYLMPALLGFCALALLRLAWGAWRRPVTQA